MLRRRLFTKYVVLIAALVSFALIASNAVSIYFSIKENQAQLTALQGEAARAAATRIELYFKDIENQIGWTAFPQEDAGSSQVELRRFEYLKLLRQVPAITEVAWLDHTGHERLRVSRLSTDVVGTNIDYADKPAFKEVGPGKAYFGPAYFRKETEPYVTIARSAGGATSGVTVAEVNLKLVWDVVNQIKIGNRGLAYVVNADGILIAHPDLSLVLQKTDFSKLSQVAALKQPDDDIPNQTIHVDRDFQGKKVLTAHARIPTLGWNVFVEMPLEEAYEPLYSSIYRTGWLMLAGLALSVVASMFLARRMMQPIHALQAGAASIGAGNLGHRIEVHTQDELESLADQFNSMTSQLRESYANLEKKVDLRTSELHHKNQELKDALDTLEQTKKQLLDLVEKLTAQQQIAESANLAKSRFLAAASHDLRQPMHALSLYLEALAAYPLPDKAVPLLENVQRCAQTMDDMFRALLDISRLDASAVLPSFSSFPIAILLDRICMEFTPQANAKGLQLHVRHCSAFVHTDSALLERVLRNLVSNAVRYTDRGKILVGCRRIGSRIRLEVHDTGLGIAPDQQTAVFEEFYQVNNPERNRAQGLGLGLAIVHRLARLLETRIVLVSEIGRGSSFSIELPCASQQDVMPMHATHVDIAGGLAGLLVLVVDDETAILDATKALLEQWGCVVIAATSGSQAMERLSNSNRVPDALICDYRLQGEETGIGVVETICEEFNCDIPALLVTGDTAPERMHQTQNSGLTVLHKPVQGRALHAALTRILRVVPSEATSA